MDDDFVICPACNGARRCLYHHERCWLCDGWGAVTRAKAEHWRETSEAIKRHIQNAMIAIPESEGE